MITEKILETLSGFECIKGINPQIDFLVNGGISVEPLEDKVAREYVGGDSLREFSFKVAVSADYFEGNPIKVYEFFEAFKDEIETCEIADLDENKNAIRISQEGAFEMEHLSAAQTKYAVKCVLTYYKRGD